MWFPKRRSKADVLEDEVAFLRAQVAQLQNYILMVSPTQLASVAMSTQPYPESSSDEAVSQGWLTAAADEARRMYSTEEEEDIEFQREEGLIGHAEAERLLRNVGAINDDLS